MFDILQEKKIFINLNKVEIKMSSNTQYFLCVDFW